MTKIKQAPTPLAGIACCRSSILSLGSPLKFAKVTPMGAERPLTTQATNVAGMEVILSYHFFFLPMFTSKANMDKMVSQTRHWAPMKPAMTDKATFP